MSFEQDVINRTTQKLAALVKRANELDGSAEAIPTPGTEDVKTHSYKDLENTDAYKNIAIPETTWFENLANSAPVSKLLDLAEATGVDRWADTANDFAGNIGTGLGNIVNSLDSSLKPQEDVALGTHIQNLMDEEPNTFRDFLLGEDLAKRPLQSALKRRQLNATLRNNPLAYRDFLLGSLPNT